MRSLTLLLIPLIFLSSCTIDWNDEKNKKNDTFLKNIECSKYKNEIETKIDKENKDWGFFTILTGLFYSQAQNFCVYSLSIQSTLWNEERILNYLSKVPLIALYSYNNWEIRFIDYNNDEKSCAVNYKTEKIVFWNCKSPKDEFNKSLQELKWE